MLACVHAHFDDEGEEVVDDEDADGGGDDRGVDRATDTDGAPPMMETPKWQLT